MNVKISETIDYLLAVGVVVFITISLLEGEESQKNGKLAGSLIIAGIFVGSLLWSFASKRRQKNLFQRQKEEMKKVEKEKKTLEHIRRVSADTRKLHSRWM